MDLSPSFHLQPIWDALSAARLAPYLSAGGHREAALEHYRANVALCEALYPSLHLLEVTFRNRFEAFLKGKYGDHWYTDKAFMAILAGQQEERLLQEAVLGLGRRGRKPSSGAVVAELNFGFWTGLLGNRYQGRFWGPAWRVLFPHQDAVAADKGLPPPFEKSVNSKLRAVRHLRNRVFHHEPIWADVELWSKYQDIRLLIGWISPDIATWSNDSGMDRFPSVFRQTRTGSP